MNLDDAQNAARDQFTRQAANYGKSHILADVADVEAALAHLPDSNGQTKHALDVATGGGHTALCLARHGYEVSLSDLSPAMLESATALLADSGFAPTETRCNPAEQFPYEDESFDLVTCRVAAHHFSNPAQFVAESSRVLNPGGALVAIDGSVDDDHPIAEEWPHRVEKLRDPSHGRFITPEKWRLMCAENRLQILDCELHPMLMPDLEWYFQTANTSPENRAQIRTLVRNAPEEARRLFRIAELEDGTLTWHWRRLTLVAEKPG